MGSTMYYELRLVESERGEVVWSFGLHDGDPCNPTSARAMALVRRSESLTFIESGQLADSTM